MVRAECRYQRTNTIAKDTQSAFWSFSLAFYRPPDVQAACLALQDDHGADVNVALYVLFLAALGRKLAVTALADIDAAVSGWREEVVWPLRNLRRRLKAHPFALTAEAQEGLRSEIKRVELLSEQAQQLHLEALVGLEWTESPAGEAATANLTAYADFIGADPKDPSLAVLLERFGELAADA